MFITRDKFISYITTAPQPPPPQWKIRKGNGTLETIAPPAHLKKAHQNIPQYLTNYYNRSLDPTTAPQLSTLAPAKLSNLNNNTHPQQKNIIRNLHYKSILENTTTALKGLRPFLKVIKEFAQQKIADYKLLTPSAQFYIKEGRIGSVFSSYYFRASIMNPYMVYSIAKHYTPTRVFTPTLGWSSYMRGFLEAGVQEYVGTDVIPAVCRKTQNFADQYYPDKTVNIYCEPSENLKKIPAFARKYRAHFDLVFFSPPYYEYEIYEGAQQSTKTYKTYEEWLAKYWEETIKLAHYVLRPGGKLLYIISSYEGHDLVRDMNQITAKYFAPPPAAREYKIQNKNVHVTTHRETNEILFEWTK
jgi:hypothetical protein